jgi:hypothetical protein
MAAKLFGEIFQVALKDHSREKNEVLIRGSAA